MTSVLITGARAPVAVHLARLFHAAGHRVVLADSQHFPMGRATRMKHAYVRLPAPRGNAAVYAGSVEACVREHGIDLVIPTCEEVFFVTAARELHRKAIPLFAPDFAMLGRSHHKAEFAASASGFGADPPETTVLNSAADLAAIRGQLDRLVLKPAWSRFASRVLIRPRPEQIVGLAPTKAEPWVAQAFLPGEELCAYAVARNGRLTAFAAYRPLHRAGQGAGVAFEPVTEVAAQDFAAGYVATAEWTGQISFDFRRDERGRLHVIECNPRATSGLHFFAPGDGLVEAILDGVVATPTDLKPMTLPLALLAFGLPAAIRSRTVGTWWRDFRTMGDISVFPGDQSLLLAQLLALGEATMVALRSRKTLLQASTADIEWNGESLG